MDQPDTHPRAAPLLDRTYWLSRPVEERFAAMQAPSQPGGSRARVEGLVMLAEKLNASGVDYLVVGGYAVTAHGAPRPAEDLDLWIEPVRTNITLLLKTLAGYGFRSLDLTPAHRASAATLQQHAQLGQPPARVDLLTSLGALRFADCHERRETMPMLDTTLPFIGFDDLCAAKRSAGRAQDRADLDHLFAAAH